MTITPCMGGWCAKRDRCPHYTAPDAIASAPAERLCPQGRDGEMLRRLASDPRFAAWAAGAPAPVEDEPA